MPPILERWIPAWGSWSRYDVKRDAGADVGAGLTVAVMLVPQGMAYAMLAGLPPVVGLYASIAPLLAYVIFGTSRQLAVGPVAMDSLLVAAGVGAIAQAGSPHYLTLAITLAGMVGVLQIGMGLVRLGRMRKLLSPPVITGFTAAAAVIIGLSQLKHLLGASIPRSARLHELLLGAAEHAAETHLPTLLLGAAAIVAIAALKRWNRRFPGALAVVVVGATLSFALSLSAGGMAVVGHVPPGLPALTLTLPALEDVWALLPMALAIALVGFTEAIGVGEVFAKKNGYALDPDRELIALGASNLAAFAFGGYPVTGGLSRTAINAQAGARSRFAGLVTAVAIAIGLLFLTPLFAPLPKAILAAIVMTAVAGLIDLPAMKALVKGSRADAAVLALTVVVTLFVGIPEGIAAGVLASLAAKALRSRRGGSADDEDKTEGAPLESGEASAPESVGEVVSGAVHPTTPLGSRAPT